MPFAADTAGPASESEAGHTTMSAATSRRQADTEARDASAPYRTPDAPRIRSGDEDLLGRIDLPHRRRARFGLELPLALLLTTLFVSHAFAVPDTTGTWDLRHPHRSDRLLAMPRSDLSDDAFRQWCRNRGTEVLSRHPAMGDVHVVRIPPGRSLEEELRRMEGSGMVEFAEPDYLLRTTREPNDPNFLAGLSWGLRDFAPSGATGRADIGAPEAWDVRTDAGDVIVAVIDSGIRPTHQDLRDNLWRNPGEISGSGRDDDGNGYIDDVHGIDAIVRSGNPWDTQGHGTHVAGIVGAVGNNGIGSAGVAWRVQLMALRFIGDDGEGATSDAVRCLDYARAHGARIVNASWGSSARSQSLRRAIERARSADMIVVAGAGNSSANLDRDPFYPAAFDAPNLLSVASSDRTGGLASSSSYGPTTVDLAAPGEGIHSTWATSDSAYRVASGASMAAPHVTGTLALLAAECPSCSATELIDAILNSVDPVPSMAGKVRTGGRLNAGRALARVRIAAIEPPTLGLETVVALDPAVSLGLNGTPGTAYWIESSPDLRLWTRWVRVVVPADGRQVWQVDADGTGPRFYRALRDP